MERKKEIFFMSYLTDKWNGFLRTAVLPDGWLMEAYFASLGPLPERMPAEPKAERKAAAEGVTRACG
jgi:hypothetical protein